MSVPSIKQVILVVTALTVSCLSFADNGLTLTGADAPKKKAKATHYNKSLPALPIEDTGNVLVLPENYPEHWIIADDINFSSMLAGKVFILDVTEKSPYKQVKGIIDKSLIGNIKQSKTRGEIYILETFHERGTRGPKTEILTVYDQSTLFIKKEILWNRGRFQGLPERFTMSFSEDEKFLYAFNFDPASSFTVVDLDTYEIVADIETPGCVLTYPVGRLSVASLCSNGSMLTTLLNKNGTLKSQARTKTFFDTDKTPIFEHPIYINKTAYFMSFEGVMHSFDMSGDIAKYSGSWDMLSAEDKQKNNRPSGLVLNSSDDSGLIYSIFQEDGREGSQTHGGNEVRVYDPVKKKLVRRIKVPNWAISMVVTRGANPYLVITNGELGLDVFDANTGDFIQNISNFGQITPLMLMKAY